MKTTTYVWASHFVDSDDCQQYFSVFVTEMDALRSVAAEMASWMEFNETVADEALDRLAEKINQCDYYAALDIWNVWQDEHGTGLELSIAEQPLFTDISLPSHCNRKVNV